VKLRAFFGGQVFLFLQSLLSKYYKISLRIFQYFWLAVVCVSISYLLTMPREGSRPKKRKFHGNKFENPVKKARVVESINTDGDSDTGKSDSNDHVEKLSASARKIGTQSSQDRQQSKQSVTGYRFVDMELLSELFQQMVCKECGDLSGLVLEDKPRERKGSASHLRIRCEACGWVYAFDTSKKVQHTFDINRRLVYAMRSIGQGHASIKRFCTHMNMPPPLHFKAYRASNIALSRAAKSVATTTMKEAADELHQNKGQPDNQITQCSVSCDGTWQRRGYSSLNGCVTTLSIETGKCLDVEILTKVCHGCQKIANETDDAKKADLKERHQCKANYKGSAPSMETEGIKRIFGRSEESRKLQYTEYFGDGDSKAYSQVENFYENIHVEKKECVGHVQKRVGTALRKMKKENKGIGGKGKLTDSLIDKLQNYYGIAIRSNSGDLAGMKSAIYASLFHCVSSEKRSLHQYCPDGPDSWCRFKQDEVNQAKLYKPGPGLPDNIIALIKPIYSRLSSDNLLNKCLDGKTQNQNESLNGMFWNKVPKSVFVGADVLELGIYDAVAHYNVGSNAAADILSELGLVPGHFFEEGVKNADTKRVKKADHRHNPEIKKRRKVLRGQKKKKEDKTQEKEGNTYEAGAF